VKRLDLLTVAGLSLTALLSFILVGFSGYLGKDFENSQILLQFASLVILGWWIVADAARRNVPLGLGSGLAALACLPAFFLFYCFHSRGRQGRILALSSVAAATAYVVISATITLLTGGLE
jgi:hypothetical protein